MDATDYTPEQLLAEAKAEPKQMRAYFSAKEFGPVLHTLVAEKHLTWADAARWLIAKGFTYTPNQFRRGYELWLEQNPERRDELPSYFTVLRQTLKARKKRTEQGATSKQNAAPSP